MSVTKQLMGPIEFHWIFLRTIEVNGVHQLFVFCRRNKFTQVWNNLRVRKWQNFHFWVNYPFKWTPTITCNILVLRSHNTQTIIIFLPSLWWTVLRYTMLYYWKKKFSICMLFSNMMNHLQGYYKYCLENTFCVWSCFEIWSTKKILKSIKQLCRLFILFHT